MTIDELVCTPKGESRFGKGLLKLGGLDIGPVKLTRISPDGAKAIEFEATYVGVKVGSVLAYDKDGRKVCEWVSHEP